MTGTTADSVRNGRTRMARARGLLGRATKWYLGSGEFFWGFTDVVIRFYVAVFFLNSGIVKALDWQTAVLLAREEYPVSWMAPELAAVLGLSIELTAAVLFLVGLMTRPAAAAMAALAIISQVIHIPTTSNLLVAAMLVWYVLGGAGRYSFDHIIANRANVTGGSFLRGAVSIGAWLRENVAPFFMALTRIWLGVSLLAFADVFEPSIAVHTWLPTTIFSGFPDWLAVLCAVLMFSGFAASPVSYLLTIAIGALMFAGAHPHVTLFPFLYLSIYEAKGAGFFSVDNAMQSWLGRRKVRNKAISDQALSA